MFLAMFEGISKPLSETLLFEFRPQNLSIDHGPFYIERFRRYHIGLRFGSGRIVNRHRVDLRRRIRPLEIRSFVICGDRSIFRRYESGPPIGRLNVLHRFHGTFRSLPPFVHRGNRGDRHDDRNPYDCKDIFHNSLIQCSPDRLHPFYFAHAIQ